ncbi:MAG: MerR family transcriptional regulator [Lachnospiraceae bacterium]|nr:MerR family transcriptional regulator [Lachnospiraceae bacterium]
MNLDGEFQLLKIGELAALAGISVKALRVYEKKNVIKPVRVDEASGYRYYSAGQLEQVESLMELQDMGFSLAEIEQILSGERSKEEILKLFEEKERSLQEVLWKTQAKLEELGSIKDRMENGQDARRIQEMTDEERAWYLAKLVRVNDHNVRQALSEAIWL